jgi:hypothetical protein
MKPFRWVVVVGAAVCLGLAFSGSPCKAHENGLMPFVEGHDPTLSGDPDGGSPGIALRSQAELKNWLVSRWVVLQRVRLLFPRPNKRISVGDE